MASLRVLPSQLSLSVFEAGVLRGILRDLDGTPLADVARRHRSAVLLISRERVDAVDPSWPKVRIKGGPEAFVDPRVLPEVLPKRRRQGLPAATPGRRVHLATFAGLGDVLFALPVAYAVAEAGALPSVGFSKQHGGKATTWPPVDELPHLPLLFGGKPGHVEEICESPAFHWISPGSMLEAVCASMGIVPRSTPRTACLRVLPGYGRAKHRLVGEQPHVLIAPTAHYRADVKCLAGEQVAAAAQAAHAAGLTPVLVSDDTHTPAFPYSRTPILDLSGRLSLKELYALTATAEVVVTADTGVLHLAAAFDVPFIAVMPRETRPAGVLMDYVPCLELVGVRAADIPPEAIMEALRRMVAAIRTAWCVAGPNRVTCGVAEDGRRMARAAGVDYLSVKDVPDGMVAIVECHGRPDVPGLDPRRTVLSLHTTDGGGLRRYAACIFRSPPFYYAHRDRCRRAYHVPLASIADCRSPIPDRSTDPPNRQLAIGNRQSICWQGMVHPAKGLPQLVAAWREARKVVPDAELWILGSLGDVVDDRGLAARLQAMDEPGLTVEIRKHWPEEEMRRRMAQAHLFAFLDAMDGEQSAASQVALGFCRPVVVSASTKHDHVRAWCVTARPNPADTLCELLTDPKAYRHACSRARMGASYRRLEFTARRYRAIAIQAALDWGGR